MRERFLEKKNSFSNFVVLLETWNQPTLDYKAKSSIFKKFRTLSRKIKLTMQMLRCERFADINTKPKCITSDAGKSAIVNFTFYKNWISRPSDHETVHSQENDQLQLQLCVRQCVRALRSESRIAINRKQTSSACWLFSLFPLRSNELFDVSDRRREMFCNCFMQNWSSAITLVLVLM